MESEHVKSGYNKAAGKVKEEVGEAFDDKSLEAKGHAQQAKGRAQKAVGDAKDALE